MSYDFMQCDMIPRLVILQNQFKFPQEGFRLGLDEGTLHRKNVWPEIRFVAFMLFADQSFHSASSCNAPAQLMYAQCRHDAHFLLCMSC